VQPFPPRDVNQRRTLYEGAYERSESWEACRDYVISADAAFRLPRENGQGDGVTLNFDYAGLLQQIWKTHPPKLASAQRQLPAAPTHHELEPVETPIEKWDVPPPSP
jgi:hypothetical protein